jgi:hypothetical protein
MVIVLHARAPLKKRGLLLSSRITVDQVAAALLNGVKGTPLAPVAASQKLDLPDHFAVTLHPAGGLVALRVMADHVEVLAKTSDVGAGYHAFLVSLLESAARDLGVAWEWDDKSGYAQHRDFARLQTRMAEFLKDLAAAPEEHGGSDSELAGCRINLDSDLEEVEADETEVLSRSMKCWAGVASTVRRWHARRKTSSPGRDRVSTAASIAVSRSIPCGTTSAGPIPSTPRKSNWPNAPCDGSRRRRIKALLIPHANRRSWRKSRP